MNYEESLHYLDELNTFGIRLGLTRMEELCARLGHPERSYRVIHIAGTNGKGSVTQMMDAVCRASGICSGRYLSPHLISYTERMSVGGEEISEEQFAALLTRVRAAADAPDPENVVTGALAGAAVYLPLAGLIDVEKETARLTKERDNLDKEIGRLTGKLANAGFTSKAPAAVVAAEREKLAGYEEKVALIRTRLADLAKL